MSIVIITGKSKSGKSLVANALRNNQVSNKQGALLIDENNDGANNHLLEKIIVGVPLPEVIPANWADTIPFKPKSMIILVGDKQSKLQDFEKILPGFCEKFGPIYTLQAGIG